jgi:hypothetical protein
MKNLTLAIGALFLTTSIFAQTFNLTVNNGYGSGTYQAGDTVHIWSMAYDSTKTFGEWTGDIASLHRPKEWHTILTMPNQNISVTAVIDNMPAYSITYELMQGLNNPFNVYYYFPPNPIGIVYLFHGTGGSAENFIYGVENRSFTNAAIARGYAVVSMDAEEVTLNQDIDGDGGRRFMTQPIDTINNVDYRNIKKITIEFINRGWITAGTPRFSIGMSAGSNFSAATSYIWNFTGVGYCSRAQNTGFDLRTSPFAYRLARYDDNPSYNYPVGLQQALANVALLDTRGICNDLYENDRQPIYPERFARVPGISVANSILIYNELVVNNQIDANGYALNSSVIEANVLANPSAYPTIVSFVNQGITGMVSQIGASNAEHSFYSDYNAATLDFFADPCGTTVGVENPQMSVNKIKLYPNPFNSSINISGAIGSEFYSLTNLFGQMIWSGNNIEQQDFSSLTSGIYFLTIAQDNDRQTFKLIKE